MTVNRIGMFFADNRTHFFRPLTGKYREAVVECLRLLYQRLYTDLTDFGHLRSRDQILDIFQESIARAPVLDSDSHDTGEEEGRFRNQRELAGFILNLLLEHGWLEKQLDEATLQSTYAFSKTGRQFTEPFVDNASRGFRTRNRNTRNTRNSLQAFYERGEIHDLLDAYEYSERIISDFTDVIAELEERKRQLVREVESRQLVEQATDEFFEFMEQRFKPDLEVRLSADSVEKYRDQITGLIQQIRRKRKYGEGDDADKDWRAVMETRLRRLLPGEVVQGQSILENLLVAIEERLRSACEGMLPALRKSLNSFTQRADIIMRQLSYLHTRNDDGLLEACQRLSALPGEQQAQLLSDVAPLMDSVHLGFIDPGQIQIRERSGRRVVQSRVADAKGIDREGRRDLFIQQALDQAFSIQGGAIRDYIHAALVQTGQINSRHLPVSSARELLALAHAIEVGSADTLSSEYRLQVQAVSVDDSGAQWLTQEVGIHDDDYFTRRDEFIIQLVDLSDDSTSGQQR